MPDIIQLLPDSVANQIAAGEVVQRPASAVKELLENAIDAKAKEISLVIKNAGKTSIKVIDDGIGMSETDARLSLERHATSKIKNADDLFSLTTMGFRGEAVPSMAAISQMEIKSKTKDHDLGTLIKVEGSEVVSQEFCQAPIGTSFTIKNLFYNVPARRNFLKSNPVEVKHIIEEFIRVAMINHEVSFNMDNDNHEVFRLKGSSFRQRVIGIMGKSYDQKLVPVKETTDIVSINGYIGKPEFARKTRGEQYIFVNKRFIKSPYLNHAIQTAYEELLPNDQYPSYFLALEIDPSKIDINIHPTKTEVKFEEERAIYAIIKTAIRQALGKYNIAPSLDFEQEQSFNIPLKGIEDIRSPEVKIDGDYNPFSSKQESRQAKVNFPFERKAKTDENWQKLYASDQTTNTIQSEEVVDSNHEENIAHHKIMQLHNKFILTQLKSGFLLIDQHRAHQRILIDALTQNLAFHSSTSQQLLFPQEVNLNASDFAIVIGLIEDIRNLGFNLEQFGKNSLIINGIPEGSKENDAKRLLEAMIEEFKMNQKLTKDKPKIGLIHALANSMSIKSGVRLQIEEMNHLVDQLFATEMPYHLPNGKPIVIKYDLDDLNKKFKYS